jgi:hypothetical protein
MLLKSLWIWLSFIPLAIANGILREKVLSPRINDYALPVSALTLCLMIAIVSFFAIPALGQARTSAYIEMGYLWAALTVAFEFWMGRFLLHKPWSELLSAYDVSSGNLWLIVVIWTGLVPYSVAKLRHLAF